MVGPIGTLGPIGPAGPGLESGLVRIEALSWSRNQLHTVTDTSLNAPASFHVPVTLNGSRIAVNGQGRIDKATESAAGVARGVAFILDMELAPIAREIIDGFIPELVIGLRGDFVLDAKNRAIDAEFVRGQLPTGDSLDQFGAKAGGPAGLDQPALIAEQIPGARVERVTGAELRAYRTIQQLENLRDSGARLDARQQRALTAAGRFQPPGKRSPVAAWTSVPSGKCWSDRLRHRAFPPFPPGSGGSAGRLDTSGRRAGWHLFRSGGL